MKVKIVPDPELGEIQPETLTLFGQVIGRNYTKVEFTDAQLAKVRGNRFFHIEGDPLDHDGNGAKGGRPKAGAKSAAPVDEDDAEALDAARARLDELGVKYDGRLGLEKLQALVAEAEEKAKSQA